MKLFLDENVTPKAQKYFEKVGYDVQSIHSLQRFGLTDMEVFKLAQKDNRALLTHNGKDFIVQIPPQMMGVEHEGLLWLKYEINRANVNSTCAEIDVFFKSIGNIINSIWVYNGDSNFALEFGSA